MKKTITIFFLFIFTSATTEFGQFLKLPFLVQHYYFHQKQKSIGLLDFLVEHYTGNHEDADKKEDLKLPFKIPINSFSVVIYSFTPRIELPKLPEEKHITHTPTLSTFISSSWDYGIFHPPRTV